MTAKGYLPLLAIGQVWQCSNQTYRVKIISPTGAHGHRGRLITELGQESWEIEYVKTERTSDGAYIAGMFSPDADLARLIYTPYQELT